MAWPFWTCIFHQFWCSAYWCWEGSSRISWHECWEVYIYGATCATSTTSDQWRCKVRRLCQMLQIALCGGPSQNSQVALLVGDLSMQEVQAGYRRERRRVLRLQTSATMSLFTLDVNIQLKWWKFQSILNGARCERVTCSQKTIGKNGERRN